MQQTCMAFLDWVDAVKWLKKSLESSSVVKEEEDLKHYRACIAKQDLMARQYLR